MSSFNSSAIMKKLQSYSESKEGKAKIDKCISDYRAKGATKTLGGSRLATEADMYKAVGLLCSVLKATVRDYDLPDSVVAHFESLSYSKPVSLSDGSTTIYIYFDDDLSRDSLYPSGYDGVDNIIALLNNGYSAKNFVSGEWHGRYVWSIKEREGLHFINQAIRDFNSNYGADFNVTAVASEKYN